MTDFDYLPETANELVVVTNDRCICRHDDVVDSTDVEKPESPKPFGKWYPRTIWKVVEYNPECRYGDHAERFKLTAKQSEPNIIT